MQKKKIAPFQIKKIPRKQFEKLMVEYNDLEDIKSLYHFIKYLKKNDLIIVNKQFKKKAVNFSIKAVASISLAGFVFSTVVPKMKKDDKDLTATKTTINQEYKPEGTYGPILSDQSLNDLNKTSIMTPSIVNIDEYTITEEPETILTDTTIAFPKASNTNESSDYENYYKVRDKYGLYIDKIAKESGVDSRIITAMIAQENPNGKDETSVGTYGPMCVTSIHNNETYNYGYYNDDGLFETKNVTIDINNLKDNSLYANGEYGNITVGDAYCILYGTVILKAGYTQINKSNDNLSPEEKIPLAIAAYNQGYPDVIKMTKNYDNLYDACYSIRYDHSSDSKSDDDQYIEHVFNKIPNEELNTPITFTDNNGNILYFNLVRNNEIATISLEKAKKHEL